MSVLAISSFEWTRLFLTRRGWLSIAALLLVWFMILTYIIAPAARTMASPDFGGVIGLLLESIGLDTLSRWPSIELALYWLVSLYLLPMFTLVIAADQIASDKARGTLRFLALRSSRTQLFLGRFLGQFLIQLMLVLATLGSVLILVFLNTPETIDAALSTSPVIIVNLMLVLLPYIALMALVSVLAKSARQATIFAMIAWIVVSIVIGIVQSRYGPFAILDWVLPGSQISSLIKLQGWDTLNLAAVPLIHTAVLLLFGWIAMQRTDL